jgi:hypothetical protein
MTRFKVVMESKLKKQYGTTIITEIKCKILDRQKEYMICKWKTKQVSYR